MGTRRLALFVVLLVVRLVVQLAVIVGTFALVPSAAAGASCRIEVAQARLGVVKVKVGGGSFEVGLDGVPVSVDPVAHGKLARVLVQAPLRFSATYPADALALRLAASEDLFGGRIRLGAGSAVLWRRVRGDQLLISVDRTLGVEVGRPLAIPCREVSLANGAPASTPQAVPPSPGPAIGAGPGFFPLHLEPRRHDPLQVKFPGPVGISERRDGWVLIEASWADGSRLRGWTPDGYAKAAPKPVAGWGEGQSDPGVCGRSDAPVLRRLTVRRDAPVAAAPGGKQWAVVSKDITVEAFPEDRGDGWIRIASVPGLRSEPCKDHDRIWIRSADVTAD